ncbi:hypothetical protein MTP99_003732 [Tenebrio molitor]|nr:hypothetical protein MTP99_003732 [Tenebrio molitor]
MVEFHAALILPALRKINQPKLKGSVEGDRRFRKKFLKPCKYMLGYTKFYRVERPPEETLNVGCVTNKEFLKLTTSTCNYEDKENLGGKECRPQEPCEFPESANILSSTSVYINQEFSKPANSICIQEDKKNPGASGKVGRLQEPCEFPDSANILSSTSVYINEEFSKPTISMCNQEDKENAGKES